MTQRASTPAVVLKFGGELLETPERIAALAAAIAKVSRRTRLVIVHGGGREIDAALARAGIEKQQVDGLRITDEPTLDVVVGVLAGLVNTRFVAALGAAGVAAVGLTGADAGVGRVKPAPRHVSTRGEAVDLGRVGEPVGREKPALLIDLCRKGYVPVVSSIGAARDGRLYNVNADTFAAHLAGRLGSPRLIIAGATAGVLDGDGSNHRRHDRPRIGRARGQRRGDRGHDRQARRVPERPRERGARGLRRRRKRYRRARGPRTAWAHGRRGGEHKNT